MLELLTRSSTYFEEASPSLGAHLIEICTCGMATIILLPFDFSTPS
jgi:hypothetical protein